MPIQKPTIIFLIIGIVFFSLLVVGMIFWSSDNFKRNSNNQQTIMEPFRYEEFLARHPGFDQQEQSLGKQGSFQELGTVYESYLPGSISDGETAFLQYAASYAYVNDIVYHANIASLDKAIVLTKQILQEERYVNIGAYAVDSFDRLFYNGIVKSVRGKVRSRILHDEFFSRFADTKSPENILLFQKNLLQYGFSLHRISNTAFKLALLDVYELKKLSETKEGSVLSEAQKEQIGTKKISIRNLIHQAEDLLAADYTGNAPFHNMAFIPETLLNRAIVAEQYHAATGETPFGNPDELFKLALEESRRLSPLFTPIVEARYSSYLKK